ncbi:hypothetical protein [Pseudoalteromonas sp. MMG012]|uniref:hypothetical protein n=1 Tax=Pseudoalteromonas sp. MMG012 TaxID=2822686 RepID=UPI001B3A0ECD|nr:hypothetical protein [Pseudoalteromonas sp. MMG012]MBQ4849374.1 hypothetical protein [Pseudoalteromonas sp. MMG012]
MNVLTPKIIFNGYQDNQFKLVILEPSVAEVDYAVVMRNQTRLSTFFKGIMDWPKADMTLEENRASLAQHHQEFKEQIAFAFSVFSVSNNQCIGSVYLDASRCDDFDCELYYWLDAGCLELEATLEKSICDWIEHAWGLPKIALVGRSIALETWLQLIRESAACEK